MKTIGIIFAMQEELIELKKYLHINNEKKIYDLIFYEATLNNQYGNRLKIIIDFMIH